MSWDWAWSMLIPTTMLHLGAACMLIGLILQAATPNKSAASSCILMIIGGFGVGGAAAGWIGGGLDTSVGAVAGWTGQLTTMLTGVSFPFLLFAIPMILAWRQVKGGKGGGKSSGGGGTKNRAKQAGYSFMFACLGTVLAAVPPLFAWTNTGIYHVGTAILAITPA